MKKRRTSKNHFFRKYLFLFLFVATTAIGIASLVLPKKHAEGAIDSISYYALPVWNGTTLYRRGDFVQFQGGYYESLHENVNHRPDLNIGFLWQVLPSINESAPLNTLTPVVPLRLFDITLSLDSPLIRKSSDLFATVQFTSFGTVPTPVSLDYRILDSNGQVVYSEVGEVTVETERILTKSFPNLRLKDGIYTLTLNTNYGENIRDEFRQSFEVRGVSYYLSSYLIFVICLGIIGYIIYLFYFRDKNQTISRITVR